MNEQDDTSSVNDAALATSGQTSQTDSEAQASGRADREARVRELNRQKQTADGVAARTSAEAEALRSGLRKPGKPEDYRAPEDYTRAIAEHAVREVGAEMYARQAAQAQEFAMRAAANAWSEAVAGFRERVPDFDAVVGNPDLSVTPVMADAIRESSRAGEIAYYLGKNPAEAAQISNLPAVSQATAIARLDARLTSNTTAVSRAPQPVTTLSGRGGSGGKSLEDMNFEEYRRARGF